MENPERPVNPRASWTIRHNGRMIVRDYGVLLYDGPEADAPPDVVAIADEHQVSWKDVRFSAPQLKSNFLTEGF